MLPALATANAAALMLAGAAIGPPATVGSGRPVARVVISYAGDGRVDTRYRSTPPNPGGKPDHDTAHDTSRENWSFRFSRVVQIGGCSGAACARPLTLIGATGSERISGTISHTHVDGLYTLDNAGAHCRLRYASPRDAALSPSPALTLTATGANLTVLATEPLEQALISLTPTCRGHADSIDGLLDNYFTPGFSFDPGYGPDRWFTTAPVRIPIAMLRAGRTVRVRVHQTAAGTPPRNCAVLNPRYEHCTTTGSWSGVLTFAPATRP